MNDGPYVIRRMDEHEGIDAVVALAGRSLGWSPEEPNDALFRWKHLANPFGRSPMWVAEHEGVPVACRTFLRWAFEVPTGGRRQAVRAVDTATDPGHQGMGLFRALTLRGRDELEAEGVDFVFNTPNDQSRPGYLKMGWQEVGRVPLAVRVRTPASMLRLRSARVPAYKWSLPTDAGEPAGEVLGEPALEELVSALPRPVGLRTPRSVSFLRWRYGEGPVHYRALRAGRDLGEGVALFRLRRRGGAVEMTLGDVLVPDEPHAGGVAAHLVRRALASSGADYAVGTTGTVSSPSMVRIPRLGPRLTWRGVCDEEMVPLAAWDLRLGDIELF